MATISEALAIAIQHHQAGRLQTAEQIYRQILAAEPNHADAWHLLGFIAHQSGRHEVAVEYIGYAIRLAGSRADFHHHLGDAYRALGKAADAVSCYRRALQWKPDLVESHINLGLALQTLARLDEAAACCLRAIELAPDDALVHGNLGHVFLDQGRPAEAIACYRRALELRPDHAQTHYGLGNVLKSQGKLDEAVACYGRALELEPDVAEVYVNLGNALKDQGKMDEAIACYRRVLELKPDFAEVYVNLGNALKDQGKMDEALTCYRRALELKPDYAAAHNNLGTALKDQGKPQEAVACYRRALELKPDYAAAHSNLLLSLQYCTGVTPAALAEAHAEYDRRHAAPLGGAWANYENVHDGHSRLRLGFVSPDLGRHTVSSFLVRVLENLRGEPHETICYSDRMVKDEMTHRLEAAATGWSDVIGMGDQRLAEQIRADRIDILFDLAGHTAHNRLLAFARKPAPIQIAWIGYSATTGLSAMDYLLADRHLVPEGSQPYYRERVLRMPDGYLCYEPPDAAPPVGPPPSLKKGYATFGSFNNLAKITPEVVAVWAEILRRAPAARLVLKYRGQADQAVKRRYLDLFAVHGVQPQRLELLPWSSYAEYLAPYQQVDVALDPFPYGGCTATCEALWMGVPVITCPFETFASRHSLSHLSNVGLTEMIAHNLDEYVELAVSLADDLPRLAALRAGLRQRMAASPLCDGKRFATNLLSILHDVWEQRK
jgi:protein O-GlcNAc transferase